VRQRRKNGREGKEGRKNLPSHEAHGKNMNWYPFYGRVTEIESPDFFANHPISLRYDLRSARTS